MHCKDSVWNLNDDEQTTYELVYCIKQQTHNNKTTTQNYKRPIVKKDN